MSDGPAIDIQAFTESLVSQFKRLIEPIESKLSKVEAQIAILKGAKAEHDSSVQQNFGERSQFKWDIEGGGEPTKLDSSSRRESFGSPSVRSQSSHENSAISGAISATRLKQPEIKYSEDISIECVLKFFDDCLQYIKSWEALPSNKGRNFPDAEHFPLSIMPREVAEYVCTAAGIIYSFQSLKQYSEQTVQRLASEGKYWSNQDGDSIRLLLIKARNEHASVSVMLDRLKKIKWKSDSPYSLNAFAKFSHDVAQELRFMEGGEFQYDPMDLKDFVIGSFPDPKFQKELYSIFGNRGTMKGEKFEVGLVLEKISLRIKCFMKENVESEMNASAAHRRQTKVNFVDAFFEQDPEERFEEQIQEQINSVMMNPGSCRKIGVGKDKKLLCKFLGGEKQSCIYKHPPSDLALKGTGVSIESVVSSFKPRQGKVHAIVHEHQIEEEEQEEDA